jgi:HNH endonuclease
VVEKYAELFQLIDNFCRIASSPPGEEQVFGPYRNKAGRPFMIIIDEQGNRRTLSKARWVMEQHLGRPLHPDEETIDHIDGDKENDDISNLQLLPRSEHSAKDTRRVKLEKFICPECGKEFERSPRLIRDKSKKGCHGIFCTRSCSAKYNRKVQLGLVDKLPVQPYLESEYWNHRDNIQSIAERLSAKYPFISQG